MGYKQMCVLCIYYRVAFQSS